MTKLLKLAFIFLLSIALGCKEELTNYPSIEPVDQEDNYFGTLVKDEFRNLERKEDSIISNWYAKQDSLSEKYFRDKSNYNNLLSKYENFDKRESSFIYDQRFSENGKIFFVQYDEKAQDYNLFYKNDLKAKESLVFDVSKYEDGKYEIRDLSPNHNGSLVAVALGKSPDFLSKILVIEVSTAKIISKFPGINSAPEFAGSIQWLSNNQEYIYLYFPNSNTDSKSIKENSRSVIFNYITGVKKDFFGDSKWVSVPKDFYPIVKTFTSKENYVIAHIGHAGKYWDSYKLSLENIRNGNFNWEPFYTSKERIQYDYGELKRLGILLSKGYRFINYFSKNDSI